MDLRTIFEPAAMGLLAELESRNAELSRSLESCCGLLDAARRRGKDLTACVVGLRRSHEKVARQRDEANDRVAALEAEVVRLEAEVSGLKGGPKLHEPPVTPEDWCSGRYIHHCDIARTVVDTVTGRVVSGGLRSDPEARRGHKQWGVYRRGPWYASDPPVIAFADERAAHAWVADSVSPGKYRVSATP